MNQLGAIAVWGILSLVSCVSYADTFLNDSAMLEQKPEYSEAAEVDDKYGDMIVEAENSPLIDIRVTSPSSKLHPVDPGFAPTHEVMRETEAKREADDRLWQSILSAFE